jgi:xylulokinase
MKNSSSVTPPLLMGVDLGTSGVKTILLDAKGRLLAIAASEYGVDTPHPGWAEQDPEVWVRAALDTMRQALAQADVPPEAVAAIGLSGQMHGTLCLDKQGRVLRPAIIWADQRSRQQVERVMRDVGVAQLAKWTANPIATGFMLPTWLWLREEEPEVARSTAHLLLPKDYLRYRLTGDLGTDPSDACSTLLFDTAGRVWSADLLDALEIDAGLLPPVHESTQVAGELSARIAEETGLRASTPVVYGGGDQACQAVGHAVVEPGVITSTIGTGGQLLAPSFSPIHDPQLRLHLFCHALPDRWYLMAATLSAGLSLKWLRDNILLGESYQELADLAAHVDPGANDLLFLPYLVGERTPHMDPQAQGGFIGLKLLHGRGHLVRAVMEGVVFSLRQGLDLMLALDVPVERVVASGGGTRHPLWLQLQADIFNRPIYQTETVEAAAQGAALLAGVGAGVYADVSAACHETVKHKAAVVEPLPENVARYADLYPAFCELYPALAALRKGGSVQSTGDRVV